LSRIPDFAAVDFGRTAAIAPQTEIPPPWLTPEGIAVKSMLAKFGMRVMMLSFEPLYRRSSRSDESSTSRILGDCANRRNRYRAGMIYRLDLSVASPLNESPP